MDFVSLVSGILLCVIGVGATVVVSAVIFKEKGKEISHSSGAGRLSENIPTQS